MLEIITNTVSFLQIHRCGSCHGEDRQEHCSLSLFVLHLFSLVGCDGIEDGMTLGILVRNANSVPSNDFYSFPGSSQQLIQTRPAR